MLAEPSVEKINPTDFQYYFFSMCLSETSKQWIFFFSFFQGEFKCFFSAGPPPALTIFTKLGMGGPRRIARIAQAGEALQDLRAELRTQLLFSLQPGWQRNQGLRTQKELRYK